MSFDHIVIGAGSAGCAVAAGLAERGDRSVLLLEAGPRDRDPRIRIPGAAADLWFGPLDWAYSTEPAPALDGYRDVWPRGRVLGGSSSINAGLYVRGMPKDFDDWEAAGATGWNAATMQALFGRLEDDVRGPAPHRGVGGPVRVEHQRDPRPLSLAFLNACEELGVPRVDDYHADPDGCSLIMVNQRRGRRWSAVDAFLRPHLRDGGRSLRAIGSRLVVRTGVEVERVLVEGSRAVGVVCRVDGRQRVARADGDIIVCAGAVASPALLLRSGIGPADELRALGIAVVADLAGVGRGLQDHVITGMIGGTSSGSLYGADRDPRHLADWLVRRRGPATSSIAEALAFVRTGPEEPAPDLELLCLPIAIQDHGRRRPPRHGLSIGTLLLRPDSRGRVRLGSADPAVPPVIETGALEDLGRRDLARLRAGLRLVHRLLTETRSLGSLVETVVEPDPVPADNDGLDRFIRETLRTHYHPVGTCRMGSDADAVVDPALCVRGVEGLRVADASVMPNLVRGHTNAPTMAIGVRAVDLVVGA